MSFQRRNLFFLILLFVFVSCDPITYYGRVIVNTGQTPIAVVEIHNNIRDTIVLNTTDSLRIGWSEEIASVVDFKQCPMAESEKEIALFAINNDSTDLTSVYSDDARWTFLIYDQFKGSGGGSCECVLDVRETDF